MEKSFKIDFSTFFKIIAEAKWKIKELPIKNDDDIEDLRTCEQLQDFLLKQEEDFFEIIPSNPF